MKVLVIGSGACEHAIIKKLSESTFCDEIYCAPGNGGIASLARCVSLPADSPEALADFAEKNQIGLTFTCSHVPVKSEIAECFEERGLKILAPYTKAVRQLIHTDKVKPLCEKCSVTFDNSTNYEKKARFICFADSNAFYPTLPLKEYFKMYDNDEGTKTSGMGAYIESVPIDASYIERLKKYILEPIAKELKSEGTPFKGLIVLKAAFDDEHGAVLQGFDMHIPGSAMAVLMEKLDSDLLKLFLSSTDGFLPAQPFKWNKLAAVSVVMLSDGSALSEKDFSPTPLTLPEEPAASIFHGRTSLNEENSLVVNGTRVLCVCASGKNLQAARRAVYSCVEKISFKAMYYRSDIAR